MANSNNWGEIYKSTWWGDKAWSANTLFIDSAPPGFGLNLLKASEDMDNTIDWRQVLSSVVANSTDEAAPDGTDTAEKITFTDDRQARIQQKIDLEANTTYTFSVYAKVRTGTKDFRLRNLTLGEQGAFTADTSWGLNPDDGRYSFSFTTGATAITHTLSIQNAAAAGTGEVFFWGAMLNEGATAGDYVKTDGSFSGSAPAPDYSGFGDAFGGVTAYYSLRQFTEAETLNAIRVRRSSDDTEQDIGFDANGDLDTTALTTFVNESGNAYASDFTSGNEDLLETGGTGADGQSIADVSDAYKFTQDGSTGIHRAANPTNTNIVGGNISISFDYYLPSGQTSNRILFRTNDAGDAQVDLTTTDAWTTYSTTFSGIAGDSFLFYSAIIGQGLSFAGNGSDHFYLKNIVVTQTDADGAVTTFYDQTGNGNDATNSTESEQPLVVSGGTLVEENGKAAVEFDGVDDLLDIGQSIDLYSLASEWSIFMDAKIQDYTLQSFQRILINDSSIASPDIPLGVQFRDTGDVYFFNNGSVDSTTIISATQRNLVSFIKRSSDTIYAINGTSATGTKGSVDFTTGLEDTTIGNSPNGTTRPAKLKTAELIIFESDQSSNRTGIEGNINDHFDIYT